MATKYPTISLCMIAKNEEEWIGQAISSVRAVVSEVILVDTGSTDKTMQIAEALGAKVLQRPWDNDFSAPRNLSLEHATGDWILVLDADEAIAESDHAELQRLTLARGVCYEFMQRHYSNDQRMSNYSPCRGVYPEWERDNGGYFESNCCRLFPNHAGLNFQGRIHELVEHSIRQLGKHRVVRTGIPIHHYGHTQQVKAKKDKSKLYTPLGELKAAEQPATWKNHYELAVEHNCNGRLEESVASFQKALQLEPKYVPAWTNLGYVLCEMGRFEQAVEALNQALALDHLCPEAHCNIGVVYMRTARWVFAEAHLKRAIEIKPDYVNAICNLGQTYLRLNQNEDAIAVLKKAIELMPNNAVAKADLGAAYLSTGNLAEARKVLQDATAADPNLSRAFYYLGQVYRIGKQPALAVQALERFCDLEESRSAHNLPRDMRQLIAALRNECQLLRMSVPATA